VNWGAKVAEVVKIEGYDSLEELAEPVFSDAVFPAICMNEGCDFTCEKEPDHAPPPGASALQEISHRGRPSRSVLNNPGPPQLVPSIDVLNSKYRKDRCPQRPASHSESQI
jgi:hypothetical protein